MSAELRRILFLSHSHAFRTFRVGSHHYAREFARRGAEVVHLSTPISHVHRRLGRVSRSEASRVPRGPHRDRDGVTHIVPRTTMPTPFGRLTAGRELQHHGIDTRFDAVLIDQPLLWDDSIRELTDRLVYRPTDLYPAGVKARMQKSIIAAADGVTATSSEVLRALGPLRQPHLVLGNGVDTAHFIASAEPERADVCIYVGALDRRFDWQQVCAWARARPRMRFVVVGPSPAPPVMLPDNVELSGGVPYSTLPTLLHSARVGMLPLSDDPLNAGRSPMKLYEYLAAGLSVVARATPVLGADESAGLFTYSDENSALAALDDALSHASPNVAGVERARQQSWSAKTDLLVDFVLKLPRR
ncbi:glycosyltransferase [Microbacterium sp. NPDC089321]|uniref:glycosyltransferase n=1 Tax=Microbacterium sp. NPDC089321 TaxID=3155183 RepID=UPI003423F7EA